MATVSIATVPQFVVVSFSPIYISPTSNVALELALIAFLKRETEYHQKFFHLGLECPLNNQYVP